MSRESEIQKLAEGVIGMDATYYPNDNCMYVPEYGCPFCGGRIWENECNENMEKAMSTIKHDLDCIYLIAKDLTTNL